MIDERFIYLALALIIIGDFSYLIDTVKGKIRPNKVTWLLWGFPALVAFTAQISQGVGVSSLVTLAFGLPCFLVFFASFLNKKAYWKITAFDLSCGVLSLLGLGLWSITKVGNLAILFAVLSDGLASVPTFVKAYKAPETEGSQAFLFNGMGAAVTLLTIKEWDVAHFMFPLYIFVFNLIMFPLIRFKLGKKISIFG